MPANRVRCITHYMGGGFGSKFGPDIQGIMAAELARKARAPVKLMLDARRGSHRRRHASDRLRHSQDRRHQGRRHPRLRGRLLRLVRRGQRATVNFQVLPYVYVSVPEP